MAGTRGLPVYAAGAKGRIVSWLHGTHVLARISNARISLGESPEPLYAVAFPASELWADAGTSRGTRWCWIFGKSYLERAMSSCVTYSAPEPVFAQTWHAQVFAVTVALNEAGCDSAGPIGPARFSDTVRRQWTRIGNWTVARITFNAWLETLEELCWRSRDRAVPRGCVGKFTSGQWEEAYLKTPHGQPVRLAKARKGGAAPAVRSGRLPRDIFSQMKQGILNFIWPQISPPEASRGTREYWTAAKYRFPCRLERRYMSRV